MKPSLSCLTILCLICLAPTARADVLELKNGTVLNGKYMGGTTAVIRFETEAGVKAIETSQAIALTFTTPATATSLPAIDVSTAAAPAGTLSPTVQSKSVTLPSGTMLLVRMMDSVSSRNPPGTPFTTRLEYDLGANGTVAVKGGTIIYGQILDSTQARRVAGRSTLDLHLTRMVIGGQPVSLLTSGHKEAGAASIAKAAKGAGAGAAIGAIAGDAGKGAAIGATAGALMRGQTITIPPGALLEFTLLQPVTIPVVP